MRVIVFIISVVILFPACKKYHCSCTLYPNGGIGGFTVAGTHKKAWKKCHDRSTQPDATGNYYSCVLD
jgi:hypothetical protein